MYINEDLGFSVPIVDRMAVHIRKSRALRLRMASVRSETESPITGASHHEKKGHEKQLHSDRAMYRSDLKPSNNSTKSNGRKMSHINEPNNDNTLKEAMQRSDTDRNTECHKNSVTQHSAVPYKESTDDQGVTQSTSHIVEVAQKEYDIKETKKPILTKTRYALRSFNNLMIYYNHIIL